MYHEFSQGSAYAMHTGSAARSKLCSFKHLQHLCVKYLMSRTSGQNADGIPLFCAPDGYARYVWAKVHFRIKKPPITSAIKYSFVQQVPYKCGSHKCVRIRSLLHTTSDLTSSFAYFLCTHVAMTLYFFRLKLRFKLRWNSWRQTSRMQEQKNCLVVFCFIHNVWPVLLLSRLMTNVLQRYRNNGAATDFSLVLTWVLSYWMMDGTDCQYMHANSIPCHAAGLIFFCKNKVHSMTNVCMHYWRHRAARFVESENNFCGRNYIRTVAASRKRFGVKNGCIALAGLRGTS